MTTDWDSGGRPTERGVRHIPAKPTHILGATVVNITMQPCACRSFHSFKMTPSILFFEFFFLVFSFGLGLGFGVSLFSYFSPFFFFLVFSLFYLLLIIYYLLTIVLPICIS